MAPGPTLSPAELLDALRTAAGVLSDHAAALDRLEQGDGWDGADDGALVGSSANPASAGTAHRSASADAMTARVTDRVGGSGRTSAATGTDLAEALAAAVGAADGSTDFGGLCRRLLDGARSVATTRAGRDLVAVLGGLDESLRNADQLDAQRFAIGLELGAERLAPSDDGRHAGCLPAVAASAADGALAALDAGADLVDVVIAAADEGLVELESGPVANPRLVERGVVDASAAGFLLLLDCLASTLTGEPLPAAPLDPVVPPGAAQVVESPPAYRVSCSVEPHEGCGIESANWLESLWFELGDVERFEAFDGPWQVALSTAQPGAAVEAIFDVGRPRDLRIVALSVA